MTPDLQVQFGTREGEERYGRAIAELIRGERHDAAENTLIADLASLRVPLAELCVEPRADAVHLTGWGTLQQMIRVDTFIRQPSASIGAIAR